MCPIGRGCAHQNISLAGKAVEPHLEGRQHQREEACIFLPGELPQRCHQLGRHAESVQAASTRALDEPRPVGWQLERRWQGVQLSAPILLLLSSQRSAKSFALPTGEVGVLHGERRQSGCRQVAVGLVEPFQLSEEDPQGPLVHDAVVKREDEHVVVRIDRGPERTPQRGTSQIERSSDLLLQRTIPVCGAQVAREGSM